MSTALYLQQEERISPGTTSGHPFNYPAGLGSGAPGIGSTASQQPRSASLSPASPPSYSVSPTTLTSLQGSRRTSSPSVSSHSPSLAPTHTHSHPTSGIGTPNRVSPSAGSFLSPNGFHLPPSSNDSANRPRHASPLLGQHEPIERPLSRTRITQASLLADPFARPPGESRTQLFVGNLPFRVRWQDLKDLFRKCGSVLRSDVALTLDNRSKGFGTVLFANEADAQKAIDMYNGYTWQSRVLDVRLDQQDPTGQIAMANAVAQQAQQQAHQTHQQAMQNMANMIAISQSAQMPGGPPLTHHHPHSHPLVNQFQNPQGVMAAAAANPWFAAALASNPGANLAYAQAQAQMQAAAAAQAGLQARSASPMYQNNLIDSMANLSVRRESHDAGYGQAGLSAPASEARRASSPLGSPDTVGSRSESPARATQISPHGERPGISPTAARRGPPGTLGPMPPSIFAGMSSNSHLPNPPAAAAAAAAAGYSLENESQNSIPQYAQSDGAGSNGSRRAPSAQQDMSRPPVQPYMQPQGAHPSLVAPVPMPGGLMSFYSHHNGPAGPMAGANGSYRSTPSPAYANRHLFVGNIPFNCQWQDLKDLFRAAGQILRADVSLGPDGRSRGFGTVLFATQEDAMNAVQMFNGYEFQGRTLKVHFDKFTVNPASHSPYPGMPVQHVPSPIVQHASPARHQAMPAHVPPALQPTRHLSDETSSIPGTPVYEATLGSMAAGPFSPGFATFAQVPQRQQAPERRTDVAPIGAEHAQQMQQQSKPGPPSPLPPLHIPPRNMHAAIPSPGGLYSPALPGFGPMSPQHGMPLMTPSMPGFSFHPFPQTPPLLPQFLSPGLGPFSPPLGGGASLFSASHGPSGLRHTGDGFDKSTPVHSPHQPMEQYGNYFPMTAPTQPVEENHVPSKENHAGAEAPNGEHEDGPKTPLADAETPTKTSAEQADQAPEVITPEPQPEPSTAPVRRASFKHDMKASGLEVPASPANRGVSLDIPRPSLGFTSSEENVAKATNGSAVSDGDTPSPVAGSGEAAQSKKSPWNLSWLKK